MASSEGAKGGFATGVVVGLMISGVVLCLAVPVGFAAVQARRAAACKGWNTVPILVANVDVAAGERLTLDKVSQRSIPEQFVTSSVVKPDSASYVVNGTLRARLRTGDPVCWSDFDTGEDEVPVLFAARDLEPGLLQKGDAISVWVPKTLVTRSWVLAEEELPFDRRFTTGFKRGDPLLWSHFPPKSAGE